MVAPADAGAPIAVEVVDAAPPPAKAVVEKIADEPLGKASNAVIFVDGDIADCLPSAISRHGGKAIVLGPGETIAWCKNNCVIAASKKKNERVDPATGARTMIPIPPLPELSTLSMSADCLLAAFRVPSNGPNVAYETWDITTGKKIRTSKSWQVAGGAFDAELVPSGKFLKWMYSRGLDVYDETKSGVKGPGIGLATTMSPDDKFIFIGGGVTFGTDQDTPALLQLSKNGARVYEVPKKPLTHLAGTFCPTGKVLATWSENELVLRTTDDPAPIAKLSVRATSVVFAPGGDRFAVFDGDTKVVHTYRLLGDLCKP